MSIFRQTGDGDFDLTSGNLVLVDGAEELAYKMRNRVHSVRGEWWGDATVGIPWFELVFIGNPSPGLIRSVFEEALSALPGANEVEVEAVIDSATRELSLTFTSKYDSGETIVGGLGEPFRVE